VRGTQEKRERVDRSIVGRAMQCNLGNAQKRKTFFFCSTDDPYIGTNCESERKQAW